MGAFASSNRRTFWHPRMPLLDAASDEQVFANLTWPREVVGGLEYGWVGLHCIRVTDYVIVDNRFRLSSIILQSSAVEYFLF